ncbi:glycosyltransferase [Planctomonas sp. JC2975]|uniref:glycosyltransferase n=1 Tax=Planctomonas sp. JC2975 TaxID=2729626 RepID=UPI00147597F9|nr:glycosyltransferase [Planctomonas sp. JC2975]NNC11860.1 glycosyltransferase [Planctomonas sp. JC2975]
MNRRIVVISLETWDGVWRRNQYLVDGLLASDDDTEVLFVEPPTDPLYDVVNARVPRRGRGLRVGGYGGRLTLYQPTKALPRLAGPAADALLVRSVRRAVKKLGWTSGVLWVNDPRAAALLEVIGWPVLYDVTDDWVLADRGNREHARIVAGDGLLLERSEAVVVCSPALATTKGSIRDVHLIPNAVDVARYRIDRPRPADLPSGPVALYVGTLHEDRLDVDLVMRTAEAAHAVGGTVVLLGPNALSARNRERLAAQQGLVVLGPRHRDDVPGFLRHANVLLVAHVVTEFTESLDPIKLYEYLAVGRPIVSTPVAGFRDVTGVTVVSADDFPETVANDLVEWRQSGDHVVVPDWGDRVAAFSEVVDSVARERVSPGVGA